MAQAVEQVARLGGEALLPTSVVPLTAIPTFLYPGLKLQARIVYQNGHSPDTFSPRQPGELTTILAWFVTKEGNPHNQRNVAYVEVYHPAPLLRRGVVLIDTPGIGSTFRQGLEARQTGNSQLWELSGLVGLEERLLNFLVLDKTEVRNRPSNCVSGLGKPPKLLPGPSNSIFKPMKACLTSITASVA